MSEKINQIEPEITAKDIDEVTKYLSSGSWITEHKITGNLEDQISNTVGRKHSVAVPNGTIAIYLSLVANGITKGKNDDIGSKIAMHITCLLYTSPSPRDQRGSRMAAWG